MFPPYLRIDYRSYGEIITVKISAFLHATGKPMEKCYEETKCFGHSSVVTVHFNVFKYIHVFYGHATIHYVSTKKNIYSVLDKSGYLPTARVFRYYRPSLARANFFFKRLTISLCSLFNVRRVTLGAKS